MSESINKETDFDEDLKEQMKDPEFKKAYEKESRRLHKETWEEKYFTKMADLLDEQFPKGEKCKCGDRMKARSHALVLNAWANIWAKDAVQSERKAEREKIIKGLEEMRPYPFRPCPKCGGKLELGASAEMRFGCYNGKCPAVIANNYFHIDMYRTYDAAEASNKTISNILKKLKEG